MGHIEIIWLEFGRLTVDRNDLDVGKRTAEALLLVETFTALEFEGDHLLGAGMAENFDGDGGAFDKRSSDLDVSVVFNQKNVAEGSFSAFLKRAKVVNRKLIPLLCAILLTA